MLAMILARQLGLSLPAILDYLEGQGDLVSRLERVKGIIRVTIWVIRGY